MSVFFRLKAVLSGWASERRRAPNRIAEGSGVRAGQKGAEELA
ncbi:MAG: hypothetical protein ACOX35_03650 [Bacillota bacterium]